MVGGISQDVPPGRRAVILENDWKMFNMTRIQNTKKLSEEHSILNLVWRCLLTVYAEARFSNKNFESHIKLTISSSKNKINIKNKLHIVLKDHFCSKFVHS